MGLARDAVASPCRLALLDGLTALNEGQFSLSVVLAEKALEGKPLIKFGGP